MMSPRGDFLSIDRFFIYHNKNDVMYVYGVTSMDVYVAFNLFSRK